MTIIKHCSVIITANMSPNSNFIPPPYTIQAEISSVVMELFSSRIVVSKSTYRLIII